MSVLVRRKLEKKSLLLHQELLCTGFDLRLRILDCHQQNINVLTCGGIISLDVYLIAAGGIVGYIQLPGLLHLFSYK